MTLETKVHEGSFQSARKAWMEQTPDRASQVSVFSKILTAIIMHQWPKNITLYYDICHKKKLISHQSEVLEVSSPIYLLGILSWDYLGLFSQTTCYNLLQNNLLLGLVDSSSAHESPQQKLKSTDQLPEYFINDTDLYLTILNNHKLFSLLPFFSF